MIGASLIPAPPLPEGLVLVLWTLAVLAVLAVGLWGFLSWLLARIDERFAAAIRSEAFETVVDKRVGVAFSGAIAPLLTAQNDLAAKIGQAAKTADAAHRRIDEHLEHHS